MEYLNCGNSLIITIEHITHVSIRTIKSNDVHRVIIPEYAEADRKTLAEGSDTDSNLYIVEATAAHTKQVHGLCWSDDKKQCQNFIRAYSSYLNGKSDTPVVTLDEIRDLMEVRRRGKELRE